MNNAQTLNINPDDLPDVVCENEVFDFVDKDGGIKSEIKKCGGKVFKPAITAKKVSKIVSPNGQVQFLQTPVLICVECNAVVELK